MGANEPCPPECVLAQTESLAGAAVCLHLAIRRDTATGLGRGRVVLSRAVAKLSQLKIMPWRQPVSRLRICYTLALGAVIQKKPVNLSKCTIQNHLWYPGIFVFVDPILCVICVPYYQEQGQMSRSSHAVP